MATQDIFGKLKQDHDKHRVLLDKIDATEGASDERKTLFENFRIEVTAHAAAEERTLYATMLANTDLRHDAQHSVSEHKEIDDLLGEIAEMDYGSTGWLTKFRTMKDRYLHHIDEEEEEMFPAAEAELSKGAADALGTEFKSIKPAERERAESGVDEEDERE